MSFDDLDDLGQAGVALALSGGLIGLAPQIERLLYFAPGWLEHLGLVLLAGLVLAGGVLAIGGYAAIGGILAGASGLALVVVGPTPAGVLGLTGGVVLFLVAPGRSTGASEGPGDRGAVEP